MDLPFIEKYRPATLDDVVGNTEIIERLRFFVTHGNLPNILLASSPGLGKTTTVLCLARQMLGPCIKEAFLEMNASDDRNLGDIRERVKMFSQKQVTLPPGFHKIVFLDECDSMTEVAQQALRRIMEDFSATTRFCLACNDINKVIEPVQSRCCLIHLMPLTPADIERRLRVICAKEAIEFDSRSLLEVAKLSNGDMRDAVNNLQSVATANNNVVTYDGVYTTLDVVDNTIVKEGIELLLKGSLSRGLAVFSKLVKDGYNMEDIYAAIYRFALDASTDINDIIRAKMLKSLAIVHALGATTISSELQLNRLLCEIYDIQQA